MNAEHLVTMANQIGAFFETMPDRQKALGDIAGHLRHFWEPRMRRSLLKHLDEQSGAQLSDIVLEALRLHRAAML